MFVKGVDDEYVNTDFVRKLWIEETKLKTDIGYDTGFGVWAKTGSIDETLMYFGSKEACRNYVALFVKRITDHSVSRS